jgi:phosphoglycolate phosphatase-like HAD superfamily hydrolase
MPCLMNKFNLYKVAIFDCDGVILNSNQVKSDAFSLALTGEDPVQIKQFILYHQAHGGVSRFIKFEYFFKEIRKSIDYQDDMKAALKRYAELSKQGLMVCEEIPGVREQLKEFKTNGVKCYVISGGEQQEVRDVLSERGFNQYFKTIYGSPLSKVENLDIIAKSGVLSSSGVYFGDARSDYDAAKEYGLDFVFVSNVSEWKEGLDYCQVSQIPIVLDFSELREKYG